MTSPSGCSLILKSASARSTRSRKPYRPRWPHPMSKSVPSSMAITRGPTPNRGSLALTPGVAWAFTRHSRRARHRWGCRAWTEYTRPITWYARAGGGVAAQTFHTRLIAALAKGALLDEVLEQGSEPGPQALRRVAVAAKRNRGRILIAAAHALGFHSIDTIGDQASPDGIPYRVAIAPIDVAINVLRKVDTAQRSVWQYTSGCVDAASSLGLLAASNAAQGFLLFTGANGELKMSAKNAFFGTLPFATPRLCANRWQAATDAAKATRRGTKRWQARAEPTPAVRTPTPPVSANAFRGWIVASASTSSRCRCGERLHGPEAWLASWA